MALFRRERENSALLPRISTPENDHFSDFSDMRGNSKGSGIVLLYSVQRE
jgi:hypothetical protein